MTTDGFTLTATPRDPIIARDGRPFNSGQRVRSLDWIYPSVFAGSLRTLLGKQHGMTFAPEDVQTLKAVEIAGPLPMVDDKIFVPKPFDCLVEEIETLKMYSARPAQLRNDHEGTDLPTGLLPVMLPEKKKGEFKPVSTNPFWSLEKMTAWLAKDTVFDETFSNDDSLEAPRHEERTHVALDNKTGTAKDSKLFSTTGLDLNLNDGVIQLVAAIHAPSELHTALNSLDTLHPMGGERRLVHWKTGSATCSPLKSPKIPASGNRIRMILATPALFKKGWLPDWITSDDFSGTIPHTNTKVKLVGAIVDRWRPISGWSYEKGHAGPKPVRRLVPAGSVYFFETITGDLSNALENCWMKSVSDDKQDQRDGFGLALWGTWNFNE